MAPVTLTKVGNSMAVLLPKALREQAAIDAESPLSIASPRKGVVVITSLEDMGEGRLLKLEKAEAQIAMRTKMNPWPQGYTAEALLRESKDARADDIAIL